MLEVLVVLERFNLHEEERLLSFGAVPDKEFRVLNFVSSSWAWSWGWGMCGRRSGKVLKHLLLRVGLDLHHLSREYCEIH